MASFDFTRMIAWNRKQLWLAVLTLNVDEVRRRRKRIRDLRATNRLLAARRP